MEQIKTNQAAGRWKLLAVLFVCASPLIFSYLTYYVIKPSGRTNYGSLIDPRQHPIPTTLGATTLDEYRKYIEKAAPDDGQGPRAGGTGMAGN